jgi:hypothetical protein
MGPLLLVSFWSLVSPGPEEIDRLIDRLGHASFAEREGASKKLEALGEPALPALKEAIKSTDWEKKKRAERLVRHIVHRTCESRIEVVKASGSPPRAKGEQLKKYLCVGMTPAEVHHILGVPSLNTFRGEQLHAERFEKFGIGIVYDETERVSRIGLYAPR